MLQTRSRMWGLIREALVFIAQRHSLPYHAILITVAGAPALFCYSFVSFQSVTLSNLFTPTIAHLQWLILWIGILYTSWIITGLLLAYLTSRRISYIMERDWVCYLPLILLLAGILKHIGIPAKMAIIPAISGVIALKVALLGDPRRYLNWLLRIKHLERWVIFLAITVYAVTFSIFSGLRAYTFQTYPDFAFFVQSIWGFSQFKLIFNTHIGVQPLSHASPILFLLGPIYRVFTTPITLCVVQSIVLALGALPVYWMARDRFKTPWIGTSFALLYLLYPAVQFPNLGDFHESLLLSAPLLFSLYFIRRLEYKKALIFIMISLFCKEDVAIIICMLGFYVAFIQRQRIIGILYFALGVIWYLIATQVIGPAFYGSSSFLFYNFFPAFRELSNGMQLSITNLLVDVVTFAFTQNNIIYIIELLTPFGWLSVLAPSTLILALPSLFIFLLYDLPTSSPVANIQSWHVAVLTPFIVTAAIDGTWRLCEWSGTQKFLKWLTHDPDVSRIGRFSSVTFVFLCGIGSNVLYGGLPSNYSYYISNFKITPHVRIGHELLHVIPPNASVSASSPLSAYLSHRDEVYEFPHPFDPIQWWAESRPPGPVEYVVVDTSWVRVKMMAKVHQTEFLDTVRGIERNSEYYTLVAWDGYIIFKKTRMLPSTRQ